MTETSEEKLIEKRKEKVIALLKKDLYFSALMIVAVVSFIFGIASVAGLAFLFTSFGWFFLGILSFASCLLYRSAFRQYSLHPLVAWIVWVAVYIRTRNLPGLKDITTGTWTLGPDLDPFLFLRWAKYIVAHGSIMSLDVMRYVPFGYNTSGELLVTPYFIAWFYKLGSVFGFVESITHAAVIYPVFMFALTVIAFFFLTRVVLVNELGKKNATVAALVASIFLSILPSLLPRTIAGIPEKESGAFLFLFLAIYFYISAWKANSYRAYILAVLAGLSTGIMALTWGGVTFLYLTIAPATFLAFIHGKVNRKELVLYGLWILSSFAVMYPASSRYNAKDLLTSIDTGFAVAVFLIICFHQVVFQTRLKERFSFLRKVPPQIASTLIAGVLLAVLSSVLFGIKFIPSKIQNILSNLITPSSTRLLLTVAENKQPYFTEWASNFGPYLLNLPVTFWLFFVGSIYLFYNATRSIRRKDRIILTLSCVVFLVSLIFSRYSASSTLNGTNFLSRGLYGFGFIFFIGCAGYYLYKNYKKGEEHVFKEIDIGFIVMFTFFLLSVVAARASVRTIMVLDPPVAILVGYIAVVSIRDALAVKNSKKIIAWGLAALVVAMVMVSGYSFYKNTKAGAEGYFPGIYNQQWQKAMSWVRENVPEDAVFAHWWDYGYWIQSIGERATVLDGGNAISYWNHMMGRYALTGTDNYKSLEFLYAHNVTHFLIDSSDLGKYPAFSSIGSNATYDRASSITSFYRDPQNVQEKKNSTLSLYLGNTGLEEDVIYYENGTRIFLPGGRSGIGGILVETNAEGRLITPPVAIFIYNNQQYNVPLRYAYHKDSVETFEGGLDAGIFFYPRAIENAGGVQIDKDGALFYLNKRTVHSQLVRLYILKEKQENFKIVHSEDDAIVAQIKGQDSNFGDFIDYGGVRGPIRIWSVTYPSNITYKPEYLNTTYPIELVRT